VVLGKIPDFSKNLALASLDLSVNQLTEVGAWKANDANYPAGCSVVVSGQAPPFYPDGDGATDITEKTSSALGTTTTSTACDEEPKGKLKPVFTQCGVSCEESVLVLQDADGEKLDRTAEELRGSTSASTRSASTGSAGDRRQQSAERSSGTRTKAHQVAPGRRLLI